VMKLARIAAVFVFVMLAAVSPALAQDDAATGVEAVSVIQFGGPIAAGVVMLAAAFGIGRLASSALESMARQPEVAGNIQTAMIIAAALIEGATFFALFVCFQG